MSETDDRYEVKLWQENGRWTAKLLRNGIMWESREFDTRDEGLEWAKEQAEKERGRDAAEARAERVAL